MEINTSSENPVEPNHPPLPPNLNVLILDDHRLIQEGLKLMLESVEYPRYKVWCCKGIFEAKRLLTRYPIDIALVDFRIGNESGDEFVAYAGENYPSVKCIALSGYDESDYIYRMMQAGALGYIIKNVSETELTQCIESVWQGKAFYFNSIFNSYALARQKLSEEGSAPRQYKGGIELLTGAEIEMIRLLALELSEEEIAVFLDTDEKTVVNQYQNILDKLQIKSNIGLIKFAVKHKLIEK